MNRQEKIGSLIGDIGIPILGFFFWTGGLHLAKLMLRMVIISNDTNLIASKVIQFDLV